MLSQSTFTVTTTAQALGTTSHPTYNGNRRTLHVENPTGGSDIYMGDSDVTAAADDAITVAAGDLQTFTDIDARQVWYVITASGTQDVSFTQVFDD